MKEMKLISDNILGNRIKYLRKNQNIKQRELAFLLDIHPSSISQYESGQRISNDELKIKIADFFKVSVDYLIGHTSKEAENIFKPISKHQRALLKTCEELNDDEIIKILEYAELLCLKHHRKYKH